MLMLLGLLVTCVAVECSILAGALLPFALILILAGILIFHCGWAAHLLDYGGKVPSGESFTTKSRVTRYDRDTEVPEEDEPIFETVIAQEQPPIKVGHWQFDEKESWQAVANPYPIQSTLKPVIDRQTYSSL
uniref:Uncharacterized protein n=1 Tax=Panagrolaimus sp. JU765 TaxID=591449 RepID=A0AC34R2T5_9BILA